ncbi:LLM class flavin-dependent oxidoreductase [Pseudonocardiaceae bacterium YIM PH 21723]|nr:LLM class flavin-dependent oxidoreductase [Pseudonocardiaceae bacterium YIM PH 21723]
MVDLMRIGFRFPRELPASQAAPLALKAEQLGLDEFWVVEDCFWAGGIATAGAALAVTESITVGIGVLPAVARNAALTAMELGALAELYPGRFVAGLGHGPRSWMQQIGELPPSQLTALEEILVAVRRLLAGEEVTVTGEQVNLDQVRLVFPPAAVPPILAGVRGPKSLALSGRVADGTILAEPVTPEYLTFARQAIGAANHRLVSYNWLAVDADRDRARERVRGEVAAMLSPNLAPHLRPLPFGAELLSIIDSVKDQAELAARLRPEWLDELAICGPVDRCAARVRELHAAGSESVILLPVPTETIDPQLAAAAEVAAVARG